ncbi:MAG: hypothetical protein RLZZ330_946, partial [Actinomycetota bacterium]
MLTSAILVFAIFLVAFFPKKHFERTSHSEVRQQDEINFLILLRSQIQISLPARDFYTQSSYRNQIENYFKLNQEFGISINPLIEHLILVEQDKQKLVRELDTRSSTATGASVTLLFMPAIIWILGLAIGIDIFGFLFSAMGIVVFGIGLFLTLLSRWLISRSKRQSLVLPKYKKLFELDSTFAAVITFGAIWLFGSNFQSFVVGVLVALVVKDFWNQIPQNIGLIRVNDLDIKVEHLKILALLIEAGLTWPAALKAFSDTELQAISWRIEMGQSPPKAFENSQSWQDVGRLISSSMARGTSIAQDLFRLSDEYRYKVLSYRIQRVERI